MENDCIRDVQLEIMSDGTLHITANVDVANTDRILLSQEGTHWGDLYCKDDERKKGRWTLLPNGDAICQECKHVQKSAWDMDGWDNFCHHCGADMRGGDEG